MSNIPSSHTTLMPGGLLIRPSKSDGVIACYREGFGLATVLAAKGESDALALCVRERFHIDLPQGPRRTMSGDFSLVGLGPESWLAMKDRADSTFAESLVDTIGDFASVSDQSGGYAVLHLSGPKILNALHKLVPIDVHPSVFKIGYAATSVAAHIGATFWRLDDTGDGSPVFEIAIFRSYAESFWQLLSESCAEFGFRWG